MNTIHGVATSSPGSQASPEAASASSPSVSIPNAATTRAWAVNAIQFIASRSLTTEFNDWCGGWKCPVSPEQVANAAALIDAGRDMAVALHSFVLAGCPVCNGDCGSANPPVSGCPMQAAGVAVRKWNVAQGIEARQGGDANAAPCEAQEPGPEGMRPNTPSTTTVETLVKALEKAATRFRIYAEMHRGKKTEEGDAKAIANDLMAEECEAALTSYRSELGGKQS